MTYGRFSEDGREYIVTRPDTPRPWYNRFGNLAYSVALSQAGGGYSISGRDFRRQVTWYVPRYDEAGRYLYLRDAATGDFWSATWAPVRKRLDRFECRHGLGWTTFVSSRNGILCEMTVFVPVDGPVELWRVRLVNRSRRRRRITAFPFVEWSMDDGPQSVDDLVYAAHSDGGFEAATRAVVASRREPGRFRFVHGFLMSDVRPDGWDVNRAAFVGSGRTLACPAAVERGRCTQTPACAEITVGVLSKHFSLPPGTSAEFHVLVGMAEERAERKDLRRRFLRRGAPERELERVRRFWDATTERLEIRTPDRRLDRYVNRWLVKHVLTLGGTNALRSLRIGFRNYVQDAVGMAFLDPARSRNILLDAMKYQVASGECVLSWSATERGGHTGPKHVDTKVWLVYATCAYLRETGDFGILRHRERFLDRSKRTTLLERLHLIADKAWCDRGRHGLSLIGPGDWNDNLSGMGAGGKGESVWMSMAVLWALEELAELTERLGDRRRAAGLRRRAALLREAINRHAWDGDRYIMGYTDAGRKVGSRRSPQVRLFLLPQVFAVLSGAAPPDRRETLFRTIERELAGEYGPLLMDRPYTEPDPAIGSITFLAPGMSENGPAYSHATAFKLYADGLAGRGDALYADLLRLLPYTHDPDVTLAEPFVLSNFYRPDAVPRKHGATHRSWKTSTPNWVLRAVVEGLMGVRATYDGLRVAPALPRDWSRCFLRRRVRGDTYEIEIRRGDRTGVSLDGRRLDGNLVPYAGDGKTHSVRVVIDAPEDGG